MMPSLQGWLLLGAKPVGSLGKLVFAEIRPEFRRPRVVAGSRADAKDPRWGRSRCQIETNPQDRRRPALVSAHALKPVVLPALANEVAPHCTSASMYDQNHTGKGRSLVRFLLFLGPRLPMKHFRSASAASAWFVVVLVGAMVALAARAQSPQMGNGQDATSHRHMHGNMPPAAQANPSGKSDDPREFVSLPGPMREHMLANMRDHLATLDSVIGDIADNKFDGASKLLEERLGMSSLPLHHAAEMAPYFPGPMQDAGTNMHHAASRLAIALQNASVAQSFDAMRDVNAALHEVTSSCVACHAGYRVR
jgi:hypothetical protein